MTTAQDAQVVETSVTVNNSPIQDKVHPDDHVQLTCEMTPGFKPFHNYEFSSRRHKNDVWITAEPEPSCTADVVELNCSAEPKPKLWFRHRAVAVLLSNLTEEFISTRQKQNDELGLRLKRHQLCFCGIQSTFLLLRSYRLQKRVLPLFVDIYGDGRCNWNFPSPGIFSLVFCSFICSMDSPKFSVNISVTMHYYRYIKN